MKRSDAELNRLFHDMASQSTAPESVTDQSRRRQRAIGGMRALHRSITDDRSRGRQRRRYWTWSLVAAAVALCGSAAAGAGGLLHFSRTALVTSNSRPLNASRHDASPKLPAARQPSSPEAPAVEPTLLKPEPGRAAASSPSSQSKGRGLELEEVNRLFAEAKRARREHRDADALAQLQRLLSEHPGSVLAHEAAVERFRALARLGRSTEAQHYASAYLLRYPNGFAADEARRVLSGDAQ